MFSSIFKRLSLRAVIPSVGEAISGSEIASAPPGFLPRDDKA